jgi:hypothetical protein
MAAPIAREKRCACGQISPELALRRSQGAARRSGSAIEAYGTHIWGAQGFLWGFSPGWWSVVGISISFYWVPMRYVDLELSPDPTTPSITPGKPVTSWKHVCMTRPAGHAWVATNCGAATLPDHSDTGLGLSATTVALLPMHASGHWLEAALVAVRRTQHHADVHSAAPHGAVHAGSGDTRPR